MKKLIFNLLFLLLACAMQAQVSVTGTVTQLSNGAVVPNWYVDAIAVDSNYVGYGEAFTDQNGVYTITFPDAPNAGVFIKVSTNKACNDPNNDYDSKTVVPVNGVATADFQICNFAAPECYAFFSYYQSAGLNFNFNSYYFGVDSIIPLSYAWDFGDGTTSTEANPQHVYPSEGVYPVTLTVVGVNGCISTVTQPVFVKELPFCWTFIDVELGNDSLEFVFSSNYYAIDSNATAVSYVWTFSDGFTSTEATPAHTFAEEGYYIVSVEVTGSNGCVATTDLGFSTAFVPEPDCFSYIKYAQQDSTTFNFFAFNYNVLNPNGDSTSILSYAWNFGDSTTSNVANPVHTYAQQGIYNVTLTVVTKDSCLSQACEVVFAYNCPVDTFYYGCQAMFGVNQYWGWDDSLGINDPNGGNFDPLTLSFFDYSFGGVIEWTWDFGDSTISHEQNPTHTFATDGNYLVTLSIKTVDGCESSTSYYVYVGNTAPWTPEWNCQALFIPLPDSLGSNGFQFFDLSYAPSPIINWAWDFGDGGFSSEQNPFHTYNQAGVYTVTLKIASDSCSSVISYTIDTQSPWNFNASPATLGLAANTSSTKTPLALSGLKVFPNPATDLLRIGFSTEQAGNYELRISNMTGQLMHRQQYNVVNGNNLLTTDVSKLVPGMYTATIFTENRVQTVRFVKE
jgi:hypothetical protein